MAEIQKFLNKHPNYSLAVFLGLVLVLTIITIIVVFLFLGKPSEERVLEKLQGVEELNLEIEAEEIWSDSGDFRIVEEGEWSVEANKINPKSIFVDNRWGVFFEVWVIFFDSDGLFYLPRDSQFEPQKGSNPSFKHIGGRWYYYRRWLD